MTIASEGAERSGRVATEPAIEVSGVSVRYRLPDDRIVSFKEFVLRRVTGGVHYRDLWALHDLDLVVEPGEVFGIVGRNGSGKSTLLKVVSRVLRPTEGRVVVRGRVAPMLELGAGFHPDLTGRENVFLNGMILGYARTEIERLFDEVIAFAGLREFASVPIRNYSSGMLARLGFSVATLKRPDILILDEVLAVGDTRFQAKCMERIAGFRAAGTSVLLVSHDLETVGRQCDRAAWIEDGRLGAVGATGDVLERYRRAMAERGRD